MEIVSPMSFIAGLAQKNPSTGVIPKFSSILSYYSVFRDALSTLPMARKVLASMYLIHYFNRAIVSRQSRRYQKRTILILILEYRSHRSGTQVEPR